MQGGPSRGNNSRGCGTIIASECNAENNALPLTLALTLTPPHGWGTAARGGDKQGGGGGPELGAEGDAPAEAAHEPQGQGRERLDVPCKGGGAWGGGTREGAPAMSRPTLGPHDGCRGRVRLASYGLAARS